MEVSGDALAYICYLTGVALVGREAYIHYMIVVMKRDLNWLKSDKANNSNVITSTKEGK